MSAGTWNITIDQGSTFNPPPLVWRQGADGSGDPIDITGYTARMHVRETYESANPPALTLTTENGGIALGGAAGTITLLITAAQSAALAVTGNEFPPKKVYVYDLELVNGSVITRLLQGKFTITREVTR